jgi:hypothetical protein
VTKLTLHSNSEIKISDLELLPKSLTQVHLPQVESFRDIDISLVPRHWIAMNLFQIIVTGQTLKDFGESCFSLRTVSDSIARLLPPGMVRFWHDPSQDKTSDGKTCILSFSEGNIELPSATTSVDLQKALVRIPALKKALSAVPSVYGSIQTLSMDAFSPALPLPPNLTSFRSNIDLPLDPSEASVFPSSLKELILPHQNLTEFWFSLPKLEKLEVYSVAGISYHKNLPNLKHLIIHDPSDRFCPGQMPRSLTILDCRVESPAVCWGHRWNDLRFPPGLRIFRFPRCVLITDSLVHMPKTITEIVVKAISLSSSDLVSALPTFGSSDINASFMRPNDYIKEISRLIDPSREKELFEIRILHYEYWSNLTTLSNASLQPIVDSLLHTLFPKLEHLKMACKVVWEISDLPLLPSSLETILVPLSSEATVSRMHLKYSGALSAYIVEFYCPSKGGMSYHIGNNARVVADLLLKPCYASLPSHLTRISFPHSVSHWVPKLLPRTLETFECVADELNVASYRDLPPGLTTLKLDKVNKFFPKHALALPQSIRILMLQYRKLEGRVLEHLPRSLKVLKSDSDSLTLSSLLLLPPTLTILDVPHMEYAENMESILPPSLIVYGSNSSRKSAGLLGFLSLKYNTYTQEEFS